MVVITSESVENLVGRWENTNSLFTTQQNFGLIQIESICRWQHRCNLKTEILFGMIRKHCGKGENAGYQHFLDFPQCFQKASFSRSLKSRDCVVKSKQLFLLFQPFPKQALVFTWLLINYFENTVGKGEIAHNEQFHLFPQCFLLFWITPAIFIKFKIVICKLFQFGKVLNLLFGKELMSFFKRLFSQDQLNFSLGVKRCICIGHVCPLSNNSENK